MLSPVQDPMSRPMKGFPGRKRRKLSNMGSDAAADDYGSFSTTMIFDFNPIVPLSKSKISSTNHDSQNTSRTPTVCGSCYRSLVRFGGQSALKTMGMGILGTTSNTVICSTCNSATCIICARQCTSPRVSSVQHQHSVSSQSGGTHTTYTHSHTPTSSHRGTPLTPTNTNAESKVPIPTIPDLNNTAMSHSFTARSRRRKLDDADDDLNAIKDTGRHGGDPDRLDSMSGSGCGRMLCRQCAIENPLTHAYSCPDCLRREKEQHSEQEHEDMAL
ncbi:hypothetical protein M422DRAFT_64008 [Sphaerobolus stellatus SS14]|nr:hypothetical protein M422DRAFT_64008 [Sphaerobolus stellatus SS14]